MKALLTVTTAALLIAGCTGTTGEAKEDDAPRPVQPVAPAPINGTTHYEFGPSNGCANVPGGRPTCLAFEQGPGTQAIDGFWIPLDASYWRHTFTSTIESVTGDSDCVLVAEDATTILATPWRGGDACGGIIVDGTAYIFLYAFGDAATGMTLTFDDGATA